MMNLRYGVATVALICLSLASVCAQFTCDQAIQLHEYALQELETCLNPATQNTQLCGILGQYQEQQQAFSASPFQPDQLFFVSDPTTTIAPWQNYLIQNVATQVADLGEISYVLSSVTNSYSNFSISPGDGNITNDEYYAAWQQPWFQQADYNMDLATNFNYNYNGFPSLDYLGITQTYWKAANYYFAGFWPNPFSTESLERASDSVEAFYNGLSQHPTLAHLNFTVPFNNGTATAELPGIFISPDTTKKLPVIIITGGTDFPKEMNVLQFGLNALDRGFAIVVYDGPGQGQVIRNPPYMPFYPQWDQVFGTILDAVIQNFSEFIDTNNIINEGVSLGGYLSSVACSKYSERVRACAPNPPIAAIAPTYQKIPSALAGSLYGGFAVAGQQNASLLPSGYAQAFQNGTGIANTLLMTCNASSGAPELVGDALLSSGGVSNAPIDPELFYLAGGYGGVVSGDPNVLASGVWQGYRNTQTFGTFNIGNISTPVIGIKGTEDDLLGGQENEFFSKLSSFASSISKLITFDTESGGALHDQAGSPYVLAANLYGALGGLVMSNSNYTIN